MKHDVVFAIEFKKNPYPGKFIAIEGIDGSGKTTQAKRVVDELQKKGYKAVYTSEPTDKPSGKFIRRILSGELTVPPVSLQYLFGADRAVHLEDVEKLLKKNYIVVTDRYFWSSVAYGVADMGEITDYYLAVYCLLSFYHRFMVPDISFILEVSWDTAMKRIEGSDKHRDIYDNPKKLPLVKKSYELLHSRFKERFTSIDGEQSIEKITENIVKQILSAVKKTK